MKGNLTQSDGTTVDATVDVVSQHLTGGAFFWLDLDGLDAELSDLLLNAFHFHPLAVEDAEHFGQRPKIDDYDGFTYFVVHGAQAEAPSVTVEVHIFYSDKYIVTVHRGDCGPLEEVRARLGRHRAGELSPPQVSVLYLAVDQLVDSFFPVLSQFDDRIDEIEDDILKLPTEQQLGELFRHEAHPRHTAQSRDSPAGHVRRPAIGGEQSDRHDDRGRALFPRPL